MIDRLGSSAGPRHTAPDRCLPQIPSRRPTDPTPGARETRRLWRRSPPPRAAGRTSPPRTEWPKTSRPDWTSNRGRVRRPPMPRSKGRNPIRGRGFKFSLDAAAERADVRPLGVLRVADPRSGARLCESQRSQLARNRIGTKSQPPPRRAVGPGSRARVRPSSSSRICRARGCQDKSQVDASVAFEALSISSNWFISGFLPSLFQRVQRDVLTSIPGAPGCSP